MKGVVSIAALAALSIGSVNARALPPAAQSNGYIKYSTVTGYFLQDEATTNATTFNYVRPARYALVEHC